MLAFTFDPLAAFPDLAAARSALAAGDWPAVDRFFRGVSDPVDGEFAVRAVVRGAKVEDVLRRRVQMTGDPLPRMMLAEWLIDRGWTLRTSKGARQVSKAQFAAFHDHLRQAEQILFELTTTDPANVNAWTQRLNTARGLEMGQAEAARRYAQIAARTNVHATAQLQMLQQVCAKWGGSYEASLAFAHDCVQNAPPGGSSGVVVAMAHLEQWMRLGDAGGNRHMRDVRAELLDAAHRSVLHPDYRGGYRWVADHNIVAMALSIAGERRAAKAVFAVLGRYGSELPWYYRDSPRLSFFMFRAVAGLAR